VVPATAAIQFAMAMLPIAVLHVAVDARARLVLSAEEPFAPTRSRLADLAW
jgi:hypothetical protein